LQVAAGELPNAVAHDETGAHCAFRIVTVSERRAKQAHHRVADELFDDTTEGFDLAANALVVRRKYRTDVLRIE